MASSDFLVWGNNQGSILLKSAPKCLPTPSHLSIGYQIVSLCASEKHVSFLTKDGSVFSYGSNLDGRLGVSTKAVDKVGYDAPIKVPLKDKVIKIESGFSHMCALTERGELYAWGLGDYGALGTGQFKSRSTPTKVQLPIDALQSLRQISCGAMHTAFLTDTGDIYTCGSNQYGELGVNRPEKVSTPLPVSFHQHVQQISCGVFYTLLLTKDGKVYGMGNNKYGQLGIGHKVNECHPTLLRDLDGIVKVSAGYHSGAIDFSGNLYIWGSGSFGEFVRPQKYVMSVPIRDLAIRGFFGLAIGHNSRQENRVYTWGNNTFGELAVGNFDAAKEPVEVQSLRGRQIGKIVLGVNFAMVLLLGPKRRPQPLPQWTSQQFSRLADEQRLREVDRYPRQSERKSVVGFEEGYLNSHLKANQNMRISRERQRERIFNHSNERSGERDYQYSRGHTTRRESPLTPQYRDQPSTSRDYQKLFLTLSQDYQKLVAKYKSLERQLQNVSNNPRESYRESESYRHSDRNINSDSTVENGALKEEIAKVNYELISLRQQLRTKNKIIEEQRFEMDRRQSMSPVRPQQPSNLTQELQIEYNKLLNQKEQVINKMTISLGKLEEENAILKTKLEAEKGDFLLKLDSERGKTSSIVQEHQNLIDELQGQLRKSQEKTMILREENQLLKSKFFKMEESWKEIEAFRTRMEEQCQSERVNKQKIASSIRDGQIERQVLVERLEEAEIELKYEKQFNKKFQLTIAEVNDLKEHLHKELTAQLDINKEQQAKIENLKEDVEKFKKYKKQVDEKNIIIEEHNQKFENYKKKVEDLMAKKEDKIAELEEETAGKAKDYEIKLRQKDDLVEEQYRENNRLQKQTSKYKETISTLKQQVAFQQDQIEGLGQQKASNEKKIAYLTAQLNKEVQEREQIIVDLGEVKRELTKSKIANGEVQSKYLFEKEEKQKAIRTNEVKDQHIQTLKEEITKFTEKCSNLEKQNQMYRTELSEANMKGEQLQKVNDDLTNANRDFADAQKQFNEKIGSLESRIYELEDQNKSYTPRYEALMLRNKELDQRNLELSEMINKAIEIQAESYKTNILKEVQTNTGRFINQVKEEQQFKARGRRNKLQFKEQPKEQINDNFKSPPISNIKQEPYTRQMKQRINAHKRKVSESANKLASLLDIDEGLRDERRILGVDSRRTDDLEKINSQMDSFNLQKEEFMSKIQSFAEKLKIL